MAPFDMTGTERYALARGHWRGRLAAQLVVANFAVLGAMIIMSALLQILWPLAPVAVAASLGVAHRVVRGGAPGAVIIDGRTMHMPQPLWGSVAVPLNNVVDARERITGAKSVLTVRTLRQGSVWLHSTMFRDGGDYQRLKGRILELAAAQCTDNQGNPRRIHPPPSLWLCNGLMFGMLFAAFAGSWSHHPITTTALFATAAASICAFWHARRQIGRD